MGAPLSISLISIFGASLLWGITGVAIAQSETPAETELPPNLPEPSEETIPAPPTIPIPAPLPEPSLQLDSPSPDAPPEGALPRDFQFRVNRIEVVGNTVLQDEIAELTRPFENQELTFNDLLQLRTEITQLYIDNGYITSGAFLPNNQNLSDGVVQIEVVEGSLEEIAIRGLGHLQEAYVRSRIQLATRPPLSQPQLEEALRLLQLDPLIASVNAELIAGSRPGQNILLMDLEEAPAFFTELAVNNYRSPSIGSVQGVIGVSHNNLFGLGDRFAAAYSVGEGLDLYDIEYTVPVSPLGSTLSVGFNNSDSRIVTDAFEDLDIRSDAETFSVGLRHPVVRSPESELGLSLGLDLRRSQTFLLDDPFSFSPGPELGLSKVTAIRFSQDWVQRYPRRVLAARSQFSLGVDVFDATNNEIGIDGQFFSWLGQVQWVERVSPSVLLVTRVNSQLTPDALLPIERFGIGGIATVRGYEENQIVADNGVTASLEALISLSQNPNELLLTPFAEVGTAWNNRGAEPDPSTLASVGVGLRWQLDPSLQLRLDYGLPLVEVDNQSDSLQSSGFYFSLTFDPATLIRTSD